MTVLSGMFASELRVALDGEIILLSEFHVSLLSWINYVSGSVICPPVHLIFSGSCFLVGVLVHFTLPITQYHRLGEF